MCSICALFLVFDQSLCCNLRKCCTCRLTFNSFGYNL